MIIVAAHRHLRSNVLKQLGGDTRVFGENLVRPRRVSAARADKSPRFPIGVATMCRPGERRSLCGSINLFQLNRKKLSSGNPIIGLGRGWMIALLGASALILAALQASIAAPTSAFRGCLHDATAKATNEKVSVDTIETYLRSACTAQMGSLKNALVAFRIKNGMTKRLPLTMPR